MIETEIGYATIVSSTPLYKHGQIVYVSKLNRDGYHIIYVERSPLRYTTFRVCPNTLMRVTDVGELDRRVTLCLDDLHDPTFQETAARVFKGE